MKVYNYDPIIKRYLGESEAFPSPREPGVFLLPANATFIAPDLNIGVNNILVFENNSWSVLPKTIVNLITDDPTKEHKNIEEIKKYLLTEAKKTFIYFCKENTDNYYMASLAEGTTVPKEVGALRDNKKKIYEDYKIAVISAKSIEELTFIGSLTL